MPMSQTHTHTHTHTQTQQTILLSIHMIDSRARIHSSVFALGFFLRYEKVRSLERRVPNNNNKQGDSVYYEIKSTAR